LSETNPEVQEELTRQMEKVCKNATSEYLYYIKMYLKYFINNINTDFFGSEVKIANHSTEFVNKVLDKVKSGVLDGGIDDF
jgi:hypothetical protein